MLNFTLLDQRNHDAIELVGVLGGESRHQKTVDFELFLEDLWVVLRGQTRRLKEACSVFDTGSCEIAIVVP